MTRRCSDGRERPSVFKQAAVIPYRNNGPELQILLITNNRGTRWIVPKGLIEDHLSAPDSAAVEAYEEAGIEGAVLPEPVGTYRYFKWRGICPVAVFAMRVERELDAWPEAHRRQRRWFSPGEVRDVLDDRVPRRLLDVFEARLAE